MRHVGVKIRHLARKTLDEIKTPEGGTPQSKNLPRWENYPPPLPQMTPLTPGRYLAHGRFLHRETPLSAKVRLAFLGLRAPGRRARIPSPSLSLLHAYGSAHHLRMERGTDPKVLSQQVRREVTRGEGQYVLFALGWDVTAELCPGEEEKDVLAPPTVVVYHPTSETFRHLTPGLNAKARKAEEDALLRWIQEYCATVAPCAIPALLPLYSDPFVRTLAARWGLLLLPDAAGMCAAVMREHLPRIQGMILPERWAEIYALVTARVPPQAPGEASETSTEKGVGLEEPLGLSPRLSLLSLRASSYHALRRDRTPPLSSTEWRIGSRERAVFCAFFESTATAIRLGERGGLGGALEPQVNSVPSLIPGGESGGGVATPAWYYTKLGWEATRLTLQCLGHRTAPEEQMVSSLRALVELFLVHLTPPSSPVQASVTKEEAKDEDRRSGGWVLTLFNCARRRESKLRSPSTDDLLRQMIHFIEPPSTLLHVVLIPWGTTSMNHLKLLARSNRNALLRFTPCFPTQLHPIFSTLSFESLSQVWRDAERAEANLLSSMLDRVIQFLPSLHPCLDSRAERKFLNRSGNNPPSASSTLKPERASEVSSPRPACSSSKPVETFESTKPPPMVPANLSPRPIPSPPSSGEQSLLRELETSFAVIDVETTTQRFHRRLASPFNPKNFVVLWGLLPPPPSSRVFLKLLCRTAPPS